MVLFGRAKAGRTNPKTDPQGHLRKFQELVRSTSVIFSPGAGWGLGMVHVNANPVERFLDTLAVGRIKGV